MFLNSKREILDQETTLLSVARVKRVPTSLFLDGIPVPELRRDCKGAPLLYLNLMGIIFSFILIAFLVKLLEPISAPIYFAYRGRQKKKLLDKMPEFRHAESFTSVDGSSIIAINTDLRKICYVNENNKVYVISPSGLLNSEIVIDKKGVGTHAGVRVSSFMLGTSDYAEHFKRIELKLLINNLNITSPVIVFFNSPKYISLSGPSGVKCKAALNTAQHWYDKITILTITK